MKFPTMDEFAQMVADKALDEIEYNGKTLRQWVEIILATDINVATKDGTNLAEVGTDCISRKAAINAIDECYCGGEDSCGEPWIYKENAVEAINMIEPLPPTEPNRKTATVSVGKSKGGVTMWYECAACGEPVDQGDTFCSGCGRRLIHE